MPSTNWATLFMWTCPKPGANAEPGKTFRLR